MKFQEIKGVKHLVFDDRQEFHSYFGHKAPPIVGDWREGQEGDWVEADDGGIVQILRRGPFPHPHDGTNYKSREGYVRTVVGTFKVSEKDYMDTNFDLHPDRYRISGKTDEQAIHFNVKVRKNLTKKERVFVNCLKAGQHPQMAYEAAYGANVNWREKVVGLFKKERIIKEMNEVMSQAVEELGLDLKWVISRIMNLAEESKSDRDKLAALKELVELMGAKESGSKQITSGEVKFFPEFDSEDPIAQIEAQKVEALAKIN